MRKLKVFNMISLDGYFEGKDHNINWHTVDEEFNQFAIETLKTIDTILFGRTTYQLFESVWPVADTIPEMTETDLVIADFINKAKKVVVSKTLEKVTWENSEIIKENVKEEIKKLKAQESDKDIIIYGSGKLLNSLLSLNLIDEINLMISPTVLGEGTKMFQKEISNLKLVDVRKFGNGNVLVSYQMKKT